MRATRRLAVLSAAALAAGSLTAFASTATAATALPASAAVALPTSWPAVDVADRLQPWLSRQLAAGGTAPVRVMVSGVTTAAAQTAARTAGLQVLQVWDKLGIVVASGSPAAVTAVVGVPGVRNVSGDQPLAYALDTAHTATRSAQAAELLRTADGRAIDGTGSTVAVIDSGIDGTHPFFQKDGESKVVRNLKNVCGLEPDPVLNETCFQQDPTNDTDTKSGGGHGTHVAGIVAGYPVQTQDPAGVSLRGAAPGAKLVGLSVGAAIGLLDATAAMNWVVEHQRRPCAAADEQDGPLDPECPPIRATNHSYGPIAAADDDLTFDEGDPAVTAQRVLVSQGVTVVWAAGNDGGDGTLAKTNPPAMDPTPGVLMVASYDDGQAGSRDNGLSSFSSRGKATSKETFPDLSAPGDLMTSACRPTLAVCQGAPSYDGGDYQTISGTSMATPYVAGVATQLVQVDGRRTPGDIEDVLEDTAHEFTAGAAYEADPTNTSSLTSFDKGHGLVDVAASLSRFLGVTEPPVPTAGSACTPDARFSDADGDATSFLGMATPLPSDDALDIRLVSLSDAVLAPTGTAPVDVVRFTARVTDLTAPTAYGQYFEFSFGSFYLVAQRPTSGAQTYTYGDFGGAQGTRRTLGTVTGAFDDTADTVVIDLPRTLPTPDLAAGDSLSGLGLTTRRIIGATVPDADTATGGCPFTIAATPPAVEPGGSPSATATATASASPTSPEPSTSTSAPAGGGSTSSPDPTPSSTTAPEQPTPAPTSSVTPSPSPTPSPAPSTPAPASDDGQVVALTTPVRVLDSRTGTGSSRGLRTGDVVLDLSDRLPAGASSAVLNVTVTSPNAAGFVVAHAAGTRTPSTSNVNFRAGQTQANEVAVRLSPDRRVVLRVDRASVHLIADLVGYVTSVPTAGAGRVAALGAPVRLLDTRTTATKRVTGQVLVPVRGQVPADATAVLLNVTLTGPDRRGFAVVHASGTQRPATSNVNVAPGQTQANEVLASIGSDGRIAVFLDSTTAALVVDLVGYVAPGGGGDARSYTALETPLRAGDSRTGAGFARGRASGDTVLRLPDAVPAEATGVVLNVTAVDATRAGFVTVFPTGGRRPGTSNVNMTTVGVQANQVLAGLGADRSVTLHVGGSGAPATHLVVDVVGYLLPSDGR